MLHLLIYACFVMRYNFFTKYINVENTLRILLQSAFGLLFLVLIGCAKEETGVDPHLLQDPQLGVGKWKIKRPKSGNFGKRQTCEITEIIFESNGDFKIYFEDFLLTGSFEITSETSIRLSKENTELGEMTNVVISNGNISFSINLIDVCSDTLEGEKDETYDESLIFIPDTQFENALIELGIDDENDNYVQKSAIEQLTELNLQNQSIQNLSGIEEFLSLRVLDASQNNIEKLYLNPLTQLESLSLYNNKLQGLIDLSGLPNLNYLNVACNNGCNTNNPGGVGIEELVLTGTDNLVYLNVASNDLGYLNTGEKHSLEYLNINNNTFGELFIANNTELSWLDAMGNPNLTCIAANEQQINRPIVCDNPSEQTDYWCYDPSLTVITEDCNIFNSTLIAIPDSTFEQSLIELGIDDILDGNVLLSAIVRVQELHLSGRGIEDITGIVHFKNLQFLDVHGNNLSFVPELPPLLEDLRIAENCYTDLDVSALTNLRVLQVGRCLETLDISMLSQLEQFETFSGSEALICVTANEEQISRPIQCDSPDYAWCYDPYHTLFTSDCQDYLSSKTYVPDDAFERHLIQLGIDDVMDDYVLTHRVRKIDFLTMHNLGVESVEGLQDFTFLRGLDLRENNLTGSIDLNQNTFLEYIDVSLNPVTEIHLADHPALNTIFAYGSFTLEVLEIGNSPLLELLSIHDGHLTELDISNFPALRELRAWNHDFDQIDVSNNPQLEHVWLDGLNMNTLDLSNNSLLKDLTLNNSALTSLNLEANTLLENIILQNNQLSQLDLPNTTLLKVLMVDHNQLNALDFQNFANLEELYLNNNQIQEVNLSALTKLKVINVQYNTVPFNLVPPPAGENLLSLDIAGLDLTSFNFSDYPNLNYIFASGNRFTNADLSVHAQLDYLYLENNYVLQNLTLNENAPITHISVYGNQLSALDVAPFEKLKILLVDSNRLSALDISTIDDLHFLSTSNNPALECILVNDNQLENALGCEHQEGLSIDQIRNWCIGENQYFSLSCN